MLVSGAGCVPAPVGGATWAFGSLAGIADGCTGMAAPQAATLPARAPSGAIVQSAKIPAARARVRKDA